MGKSTMGRGSRQATPDSAVAVFLDEKYQGSQREAASCGTDLKRAFRAMVTRCSPKCFNMFEEEDSEECEPLNLGSVWDSSPPLTPTSVTPRAVDFAAVALMSPNSRKQLDERVMEHRQRIFEAEVLDSDEYSAITSAVREYANQAPSRVEITADEHSIHQRVGFHMPSTSTVVCSDVSPGCSL